MKLQKKSLKTYFKKLNMKIKIFFYNFAVQSKSELYSSEWLRSKKEFITNEDNCFQNALND